MATTFGRYTLLRRVAIGGMAEIWKAKVLGPAGFQKTVAIKKVLAHLVEDQEFIDMFIEEAKLVADLVHPNIVQVFDFGQVGMDGGPGGVGGNEYFIAMEYVPGANIGRLQKRALERGGRIPPGVALYIVSEAAKGLGYAHAKTDAMGQPLDIVHRDVSPQNLLANYGGDVKVSDFGIAKAASASTRTAEGHVRGKLSYMSPEQAKGEPLDGRSDLFALGLVLYELLTGRKLLKGSSPPEIYAKVSGFQGLSAAELEPVPASLRGVVTRVLHPDRAQRHQTAIELERELTAPLGTEGLVRARQGLSSMLQSLFEEERKQELTPTGEHLGEMHAGSSISPAAGAAVGSGSVPVMVGALHDPAHETVVSPTTPARVSGLTLASAKLAVKGGSTAPIADAEPGRRAPVLYIAVGASLLSAALLVVVGWQFARGQKNAGPDGGLAAVASSPPAGVAGTETPGSAAVAITPGAAASPTPFATATPVVEATATPTRVASGTTSPVRSGTGALNVTSRPWVQVWVDGKKIANETPLKDARIPAGRRTLRLVNAGFKFDQTRVIDVPAGGAVSVHVDVKTARIRIR